MSQDEREAYYGRCEIGLDKAEKRLDNLLANQEYFSANVEELRAAYQNLEKLVNDLEDKSEKKPSEEDIKKRVELIKQRSKKPSANRKIEQTEENDGQVVGDEVIYNELMLLLAHVNRTTNEYLRRIVTAKQRELEERGTGEDNEQAKNTKVALGGRK